MYDFLSTQGEEGWIAMQNFANNDFLSDQAIESFEENYSLSDGTTLADLQEEGGWANAMEEWFQGDDSNWNPFYQGFDESSQAWEFMQGEMAQALCQEFNICQGVDLPGFDATAAMVGMFMSNTQNAQSYTDCLQGEGASSMTGAMDCFNQTMSDVNDSDWWYNQGEGFQEDIINQYLSWASDMGADTAYQDWLDEQHDEDMGDEQGHDS